jgi:anti-sigma B factor antagonist
MPSGGRAALLLVVGVTEPVSQGAPTTLPAWFDERVDLSLVTRDTEGVAVVAVEGEIDVYTAPRLRDKISDLVGNGCYQLVVDLEAVEFLDSTGLGVLVGGLKKVRAHGGTLHLVCTQERLLKIFRITGLAKVFAIHDDVASAVAAASA